MQKAGVRGFLLRIAVTLAVVCFLSQIGPVAAALQLAQLDGSPWTYSRLSDPRRAVRSYATVLSPKLRWGLTLRLYWHVD